MDQMANMAAFTKVVGTDSFSAVREMQVPQALVTKRIQPAGKLACRVSDRAEHRARWRQLSGAGLINVMRMSVHGPERHIAP